MKTFHTVKYILILTLVLIFSYLLPHLWNLGTETSTRYPFSFYSSLYDRFFVLNFSTEDESLLYQDKDGNSYSEQDFFNANPMYYYRQLTLDGSMPDTIKGVAMELKEIKRTSFHFRHRPSDTFTPKIPLYTLFESMSGKVDLEMPGDFFRMTNTGIEFIDPETNKVKAEKSAEFSKPFQSLGYEGPAKIMAGNPSTRKAYDEGNLILDKNNMLFHLKMVNGKPFVRKSETAIGLDIEVILPTEYADRRFYGLAFSGNGKVYIIEQDTYTFKEVPVPTFNYASDNIRIMGNMFYWNVVITSDEGQQTFALKTNDLTPVDSISFPADIKPYDQISKMIFPFMLHFESSKHNFVRPAFKCNGFTFIFGNLILVLLYLGIVLLKRKRVNGIVLGTILLTGIYGVGAWLLVSIKNV